MRDAGQPADVGHHAPRRRRVGSMSSFASIGTAPPRSGQIHVIAHAGIRGALQRALDQAGVTGPLVGIDVGTSGVKGARDRRRRATVLARAEAGYPLSTPRPGWAEQDPADWWDATEAVLAQLRAARRPAGRDRPERPDARARRARRAAGACCGRRSSGTTSAPAPSARRSSGRSGCERLIALTGNRALPGFTAPKLLWLRRHEPERVRARSRGCCCRRTTCGCGYAASTRPTSPTRPGTLLLDVAAAALERGGARRARARPVRGCPPVLESPEVSGVDRRRRARRGGRRRPGRGRGRRRRRPARAGVGRARDLGGRVRGARARSPPTRRRACTRSATRCPAPGTRWA